MWGNAQMLGQNLPIPAGLIEQELEIRVAQNILDFPRGQEIVHILRDSSRNPTPFAKTLPDFHGVGGSLLLLEQQVELIYIEPSRPPAGAIRGHPVPDRVLQNEHSQLLELLSEFLYIEADQAVSDIDVCVLLSRV